jgi:hypothetical protein
VPSPSPDSAAEHNDPSDASGDQAHNDGMNFDDELPDLPHPSGPSSQSTRSVSSVERNNFDTPPEDFSSPLQARTLPVPPPDILMENEQDELIEDLDLSDDNMHVDREYRFDRLLDDPYDDLHRQFLDFIGNEIDHDLGEDNPDQVLFNENFGLPEGENAPEPQAPRFQFEADQAFDRHFDQPPDDDPDDEGNGFEANYQAFREHELVRNAYIDAFIQKVIYGATHRALKHQLKAARRTIAANPLVPREDVANMARTIGTAEVRLGVNTDDIVTTFTLCPHCKRRYSPEYIATANEDTCLNDGCEGVLFTVRNLASGSRRRVPNLTYPFASPIAWLKHMLSLPGMSELMQNWRNDQNDDWGLRGPISSEEWMRDLNVDRPIGDISDGWGWRSTSAGLERRYDPHTGNVADESVLDPPIRFVSLPFGLSLSLNTDWSVNHPYMSSI